MTLVDHEELLSLKKTKKNLD